ncbi:MAG: hypothetical protein QOH62_59 [Solirubrobacteraceae bacterium]|jgi:hypothetical protein|nr:hypothetical protein [Solirubrobacteraceae bacterium]
MERESQSPDVTTAAERLIERSHIDDTGQGQPLGEHARQRQRSVEAYLRGEALPRYMQRARDIEKATRDHERDLQRAYERLRGVVDRLEFPRRWREIARNWDFEAVNQLVREHNEWYPVERDLPMNVRTRDYVLVNGRSYRRVELDEAWVLARFPAEP